MATLIFDIETTGERWEDLDATTQEMLTKWLKREAYDEDEYNQAVAEIKDGLGFSPLTGQIVAIGVLDAEKDKGVVYYQAPGTATEESEEKGMVYKQKSEAEMLQSFWDGAKEYQDFVSFNGRGFDVPFLMIRSAVHKIRPSKNLMSNRYLSLQRGCRHIDLMDQLSFYGSTRRKGSLHLYCRAFGIASPKTSGVTGDDVAKLFASKKYLDIAKYNALDLRSTRELFKVWKEYVDM